MPTEQMKIPCNVNDETFGVIYTYEPEDNLAPIGISSRHIHLSATDLAALFGQGYQLQKLRNLYQPEAYAAKETLTIVGPKGVIEDVRVLAPSRPETQVEISGTDAYHLGIDPPIRDSGNLAGTPGIVLVGPKGALTLKKGVILAATHLHMNSMEAKKWSLHDGDRVQIHTLGKRDLIFNNVLVRVNESFRLEIHVDTDEANAAGLKNGDKVEIFIPQNQAWLN